MSTKTDVRLTSAQRLGRGLKNSAAGPVDVTRGALGVGLHSVTSSVSWIANRYRRGRAAAQLRADLAAAQDTLSQEFAAAQQVVSNLPAALQEARKPTRSRRKPLLIVTVGALAVAGGAVAFSILRRPPTEEPPTLQPSVPVTPRP